MIIVIVM